MPQKHSTKPADGSKQPSTQTTRTLTDSRHAGRPLRKPPAHMTGRAGANLVLNDLAVHCGYTVWLLCSKQQLLAVLVILHKEHTT